MPKKNILLIVHCLPYPLNSGGRQAIFNGIKAIKDNFNIFITYPDNNTEEDQRDKQLFLSEMNGNVTLIPFIDEKREEKRTLAQRITGNMISALQRISKPKVQPQNPYSYWIEELLPKPKAYINHVNKIISEKNIEIVQCEMMRNLPFILSLPSNVKTLFVHHELGFARHQLELETLRSDIFDGKAICEYAKMLEISYLNKFDHIITLSSTDSQKLRDAGVTTRIHNSFATIKTSDIDKPESDNPYELTFVGPDNHIPNVVGLQWFLDNCWHRILQADSQYHLTIIGKWSADNIATFTSQYKNVSFAGFVDNLKSALQNTIMIVPITIGSGIRMKILEASSLGVPFISTSVGAEGIPVESGGHCLIADTPTDFVNAVLRMKDDNLRQMFIRNANIMVKEHYSLDALRKNRLDFYASLYDAQ